MPQRSRLWPRKVRRWSMLGMNIGGCLGRFHHRKMVGFITVLTVEAPGRLEFTRGRFSQRETAGPGWQRLGWIIPNAFHKSGCVICPIFVHEKKIMKSWNSKMFKFWYVLLPSSPKIFFLGWSQLFDIFCNLSGGPRNLASMYPGETPRISHRKPLWYPMTKKQIFLQYMRCR